MYSSFRGLERTREVRLGIVMYGGVSLAVYENGVAQELFRAVKGEGVYTFIKAITQSDIVVDIVSGTSAGGINGVFLGYALANGLDFKSSADLWRKDGDLMKLLRKPSDDDDYSLLDSEGYYQDHLQSAFEEMRNYVPEDPKRLALVSEVSDLDMFVTSTNVNGNIFTEFDDQGHAIDVKDHRQVFRLMFREARQNDFEREYSEALAKLCRATSCFPVAFEPVHVNRGKQADDLMRSWGNIYKEAYFLDGGLLNNKPFTLALDAIFHRTEDREVDRLLLYIEPDPERFAQDEQVLKPDIAQSAVDALVTIPGYQSIAADLQEIAEHNDRVSRYKEIIDSLSQVQPGLTLSQPLDFDALAGDVPRRDSYLQCRLAKLKDRAVDAILKQRDGYRELLLDGKKRAGKVLVESFQEWSGQSATRNGPERADTGTETLKEFDVYYRLRRLYRLTYLLSEKLRKDTGQEEDRARRLRDLWRRINFQIKILEVIQELMERLLDLSDIHFVDLQRQKPSLSVAEQKWSQLQALMRGLLVPVSDGSLDGGVKEWSESDDGSRVNYQRRQRLELRDTLTYRLADLLAGLSTSPERPDSNLLSQTDELEIRVLQSYDLVQDDDSAWTEYCRFLVTDSYIFPLQYMSNSESLDLIRTVRISPVDAQIGYSRRSLERKLSGRQLGHFGAFLKSSWRANDLMWGRLDAVCQLIQSLITPERIRTVAFDPQNAAMLCDSLFPHSTPNERDLLKAQLARLRSYAAADDQDAIDAFKSFWDLLSYAAQREIIEEEIPQVLNAALTQQADWNEFDIKTVPESRLLSKSYKWIPGIRSLDREAYRFAIAKLVEGSKPPGGWIKYFDDGYTVGGETWRDDIPKPVLAEMVLTSALLLRNCLLRVAGASADRIRRSFIYRVFISWPLAAAYYFVRSQRTMPEYRSLINGVLATLSLSILAMGGIELASGGSLFQTLPRKWVFLWFAIPIAILIPLVWYLRWSQTRKRRTVFEQLGFSGMVAAIALLLLYFQYPQHVVAHFYRELPNPFRFAIVTAIGSLVLFAIAVFSLSRRWAGSNELSIVRKAIGLTSLLGSLSLAMSLGGLSLGGFTVSIKCPPPIDGHPSALRTQTSTPTSTETPPVERTGTPTPTAKATPTTSPGPTTGMTTWQVGCVGPFDSGATTLKPGQPPGPPDKGFMSIDAITTAVESEVNHKSIRSMVLRSNADKFGLRPALRREFGSNAGLARSRAEWVRKKLMLSNSPAVKDIASQAIVLIEGPQKYGGGMKPTDTWEDRVVCVMGGW